jgi:hypothetical protein
VTLAFSLHAISDGDSMNTRRRKSIKQKKKKLNEQKKKKIKLHQSFIKSMHNQIQSQSQKSNTAQSFNLWQESKSKENLRSSQLSKPEPSIKILDPSPAILGLSRKK